MKKINLQNIIIIIFSVLYLPHAFIMVNDINLIGAYEVDPGSIIDSIQRMYSVDFYSMLNGYHSKYYGWSYIAINFWLLLPIKIWMGVFGIKSYFVFYLTVKIIYFLIGLGSVIMLYIVAKEINGNNSDLPAFIVALLYMTMPISNNFYFIHPETTGALFSLISFLFLKRFYDFGKSSSLKFGLLSIYLACLSKQVFFFSSIPLILSFYCIACYKFHFSHARSIVIVFAVGIITFFIVHPYAFVHPSTFFEYQRELSTSMVGSGFVPFLVSLKQWLLLLKGEGMIAVPLLLSPILFLYSILHYKNNRNFTSIAIILCSIASLITLFIVSYGNRTTYLPHYLFPLYIYLLLILSYIINIIINGNGKYYFIKCIFIFYISVISVALYFYSSFPNSISRLDFKKSVAFVSYEYIKNNLAAGDRVAHDHMIAVPGQMSIKFCHFWQGCGVPSHLASFEPNYIIIDAEASKSGISKDEYKTLFDYIKNNNFKLIKEIKLDGSANILNGYSSKEIDIFIYKK
jgi:hypothetical protein